MNVFIQVFLSIDLPLKVSVNFKQSVFLTVVSLGLLSI